MFLFCPYCFSFLSPLTIALRSGIILPLKGQRPQTDFSLRKGSVMEIKFYKAQDLYLLRRDVLRPGHEEFTDVIFKEDDDPTCFHLGVESCGRVVGCITAFKSINPDIDKANQYRLRALSVDPAFRRQGLATGLVTRALEECKARGAEAVWFTARVHLIDFYRSFGCKEYGEEFPIPNSCMHVKMYKIF